MTLSFVRFPSGTGRQTLLPRLFVSNQVCVEWQVTRVTLLFAPSLTNHVLHVDPNIVAAWLAGVDVRDGKRVAHRFR
jgi:hypothetical protein